MAKSLTPQLHHQGMAQIEIGFLYFMQCFSDVLQICFLWSSRHHKRIVLIALLMLVK